MKGKIISAFMLSVVLVSCQSSTGTHTVTAPTNSTTEFELTGWAVRIDTSYFDASTGQLVAKGGLMNKTSTDIVAPCRMEGLFYTDSACETKLGAAATTISPLRSGEEAQWTLRLSSTDKDLSQFPGFIVDDFRLTAKSSQK